MSTNVYVELDDQGIVVAVLTTTADPEFIKEVNVNTDRHLEIVDAKAVPAEPLFHRYKNGKFTKASKDQIDEIKKQMEPPEKKDKK